MTFPEKSPLIAPALEEQLKTTLETCFPEIDRA